MSSALVVREAGNLRDWLEEHTLAERALIARLWQLPNALVSSPAALAEAIGQPDVVRRVVGGLGARERAALA
ncbi:MAG: hypothetical protein H7Z42_08395, partial [Roseiflexaceae bacterium]|nr:hypothetical protein [Roseiflexaceae bacterium]